MLKLKLLDKKIRDCNKEGAKITKSHFDVILMSLSLLDLTTLIPILISIVIGVVNTLVKPCV